MAVKSWQDFKLEGNQHFNSEHFLKAAAAYTGAIKAFQGSDDDLAVLHRHVPSHKTNCKIYVPISSVRMLHIDALAGMTTADLVWALLKHGATCVPRPRKLQNHFSKSNRCAALLKLMKVSKALEDAEKCVQLRPDWEKGYFRKGSVFEATSDYEKALQAYKDGAHRAPESREMVAKADRLEKIVRKQKQSEKKAKAKT